MQSLLVFGVFFVPVECQEWLTNVNKQRTNPLASARHLKLESDQVLRVYSGRKSTLTVLFMRV